MKNEEVKTNVGRVGTGSGTAGGSSKGRNIRSSAAIAKRVVGAISGDNNVTPGEASGDSGRSDGERGNDSRQLDGDPAGNNRGSSGDTAGNAGTSSTNNQKIVPPSTIDGLKPKSVRPSRSNSDKKNTVQTKKDGSISDPETLAIILQTAFGMMAGVTRRKHWEIEEDEALTIAKPASVLIAKLSVKQRNKINQLASPILLGTAIVTVCMPRILIDIAIAREGKLQNAKKPIEPNMSTPVKPANADHTIQTITDDPQTSSTNVDPSIAHLFTKLDQ